MAVSISGKRKTWGIILITWPAAVLFLTFVIYAVANFAFAAGSAAVSVINVILFLIGTFVMAYAAIPSVAIGIVLLSMRSLDKPLPAAKKDKADGLSITGMVLGIVSSVSFFFGHLTGVVAIVLSAISLKRKPQNNGMAVTGLVLGIIGTIIGFIFSLIVLIASLSIMNSPSFDVRSEQTAQKLAIGAESFYASNGVYPTYRQLINSVNTNDIPIDVTVGDAGTTADVIYIPCYGNGGVVWHWDRANEEYITKEVGNTEFCEYDN